MSDEFWCPWCGDVSMAMQSWFVATRKIERFTLLDESMAEKKSGFVCKGCEGKVALREYGPMTRAMMTAQPLSDPAVFARTWLHLHRSAENEI